MSTKKPETFDEVAARLQGHGPASHKDIVYMLLTVKGLREQLRTAEAEFEKLRTKYAILNEVAGVRTQLWNPRAIVQIAAVGSGVDRLYALAADGTCWQGYWESGAYFNWNRVQALPTVERAP